ncbi:MAG: sulfatase-like hydrolase/transferase [Bacteroidota bacterium]
MKQSLFTSLILFISTIGGVTYTNQSSSDTIKKSPNIIVIVSDNQGWNDAGFNGGKDIPTPHLDQLAADGIIFNAGYASHPYCSPSRAGILTGRYQQSFGHENNTPYQHDDPEAGLPLTETTLAEVLDENDYSTCAVGKWHLGDFRKFWPMQRGFQEWFGFFGGGLDYWGSVGKHAPDAGVQRNEKIVPQKELTYLTDDFTNASIDFIQKQNEKPFFLYLAYNAPHSPIQATPEYLAKTDFIEDGTRSAYAAMVVGMDQGIGKIVKTLKSKKIYDNTLIVFLSDNGGHLNGASNYPYRGHKGMLFEGGIRVPFLLNYPAKIKGGATYHHPISALDIFPTALAAANVNTVLQKQLDGVNLLPYLNNSIKEKPHDLLFWRYSEGAGYAVRKDNWKMVYSGYKQDYFLFDLEKDPYEQRNVTKEFPKKLHELKKDYEAWNKTLVPALWQDPHAENVLKEESKRKTKLENAAKGFYKKTKLEER